MSESHVESLQRILHVTLSKTKEKIFNNCSNESWNGDSKNLPLFIGNAPFLNGDLNKLSENVDKILQVLVKKANKIRINPIGVMYHVYTRSESINIKDLNICNLAISQCSLYLCCPEYYGIDLALDDRVLKLLDFFTSNPSKAHKFAIDVLVDMHHNNTEDFIIINGKLSQLLVDDLFDRTIGNSKAKTISIINSIINNKSIALLLCNDWFNKTLWDKPLMVERKLFLGRLLSITSLNDYGPGKAENDSWFHNQTPVRQLYFSSRITLPTLIASIKTVQSEMLQGHSVSVNIIKTFLKLDSDSRYQVLSYIGKILQGNGVKSKVGRNSMRYGENSSQSLNKMYTFMLTLNGDNSYGFCLNLSWLLLALCHGIQLNRVNTLMYSFFANDSPKVKELLSLNLGESVYMGDEEQVLAAKVLVEQLPIEQEPDKFTNQIYWLTYKSLGLMLKPSFDEYIAIIKVMSESNNEDEKLLVFSHYCVWHSIIENQEFLDDFWHFINLALSFIMRACVLYLPDGLEDPKVIDYLNNQGKGKLQNLLLYRLNNADEPLMSPQFTLLPVDFIADIIETVKKLIIIYPSKHTKISSVDVLFGLDLELFTSVCILIMTLKIFKNIHLRCDGASMALFYLNVYANNYWAKLLDFNTAKSHFVRALTMVFVDTQKASYYDRINFRLPLVENISSLLKIDEYKTYFNNLMENDSQLFVHLLHLLLNDMSFLIEEVVSLLTEIKRRESEADSGASTSGATNIPISTSGSNTTGTASNVPVSTSATTSNLQTSNVQASNVQASNVQASNVQTSGNSTTNRTNMTNRTSNNQTSPSDEEEEPLEPGNARNTSFQMLKSRARSTVTYGLKVCKLVGLFSELFKNYILESPIILPQVVTCLNNCIDNLVGPNCLKLKVKNMTEYNFDPREWLISIMSCYNNLNSNMDVFCRSIAMEERYYNHNTFKKALRIARRENMFPCKILNKFQIMIETIQQFTTNLPIDVDIPEEFLDPIMQEIMIDPVLLPTSNNIMDRAIIERHLMSESTDPFNRNYLTRDDLIPQVELKQKIRKFMEKHNMS